MVCPARDVAGRSLAPSVCEAPSGELVLPDSTIVGSVTGWLLADRQTGAEVDIMTLSPYEEAALCRESSRLREEALRRLDGETAAIGFTPERRARRKWRKARRSRADTGPVAPARAMTVPNSEHSAPRQDDTVVR